MESVSGVIVRKSWANGGEFVTKVSWGSGHNIGHGDGGNTTMSSSITGNNEGSGSTFANEVVEQEDEQKVEMIDVNTQPHIRIQMGNITPAEIREL
ncbi:hypothetical protein RJT34_07975 [Clitoria ternatea]|uniref:Uncharacterized protein n=1 Tax=Clitoria ternatea TaxID=43366 RepID=A0AAN9K3W0_CLITE